MRADVIDFSRELAASPRAVRVGLVDNDLDAGSGTLKIISSLFFIFRHLIFKMTHPDLFFFIFVFTINS